jgi:hypothetical protein
MSTYKTRDIESALIKKGFQVKQSHHKFYSLFVDGKKTNIKTFISHGIKEYNKTLLSSMKNQLHLSSKEFEDLISCPLTQELLIEIYSKKGLI